MTEAAENRLSRSKTHRVVWVVLTVVLAVVIFSVAVISIIIAIFSFPKVIDDMSAFKYRNDILSNLDLPEGAEILETVHGCGNTSGTGDHTEMVVAILVKTNDPDSLSDLAALVEDGCTQTDLMAYIYKSFEYSGSFKDCYVLEYIESAPLGCLDMRGC